jgi:hypothetical protein
MNFFVQVPKYSIPLRLLNLIFNKIKYQRVKQTLISKKISTKKKLNSKLL